MHRYAGIPAVSSRRCFNLESCGEEIPKLRYPSAHHCMVPLSLMGRDEAFLRNLLWLVGTSQVVLWGVGNGMIPWVCLNLRIPILCIYDNEQHKETINQHLLSKIQKAMDDPKNLRFYKSDADLGVTSISEKGKKLPGVPQKKDDPKKDEPGPKKDEPKKKPAPDPKNSPAPSSKSSSKSSSSSSSSSKKKTKKDNKKNKKK